ncbi:hypothetical protein B296_00056820 [Ensete ventricosum]|uniref:Uncharacterized protein n=1 Tax=Ensete ventricosum TaxID=4639 RepID=A0A426X106_ENSVE|nr:hypothetical protein B296_00056820 [Ensete ventricosum]
MLAKTWTAQFLPGEIMRSGIILPAAETEQPMCPSWCNMSPSNRKAAAAAPALDKSRWSVGAGPHHGRDQSRRNSSRSPFCATAVYVAAEGKADGFPMFLPEKELPTISS